MTFRSNVAPAVKVRLRLGSRRKKSVVGLFPSTLTVNGDASVGLHVDVDADVHAGNGEPVDLCGDLLYPVEFAAPDERRQGNRDVENNRAGGRSS